MKKVVIESPFAGQIERNIQYARAALYHSISLGEAPYASHLLLPQVLDDTDVDARRTGIEIGFLWGNEADLIAFYIDNGYSIGMDSAFLYWEAKKKLISRRKLPNDIKIMLAEGAFKCEH